MLTNLEKELAPTYIVSFEDKPASKTALFKKLRAFEFLFGVLPSAVLAYLYMSYRTKTYGQVCKLTNFRYKIKNGIQMW
jgi:hypothetical protein